MPNISTNYFVYIIRTSNNKLYIGHTYDLIRREHEHRQNHHGAKFIRDNGVDISVVYKERFNDRNTAMKREKQLKGWTRVKKEALISGNLDLLKQL